MEPRPYRVSLRSLLVSPLRPDGNAWVGAASPLYLRLAERILKESERRGTTGLVQDLALSLPAQNKPTLRVEALLPDGLRLSTPPRSGIVAGYDSEFIAVTNGFDERRITFRVLSGGGGSEQVVGSVDVPLRELAGRGKVTLKGRSVLALELGTALAEGRQAGSYVDMSVVQPVQLSPGAPPHSPGTPAHAASPLP